MSKSIYRTEVAPTFNIAYIGSKQKYLYLITRCPVVVVVVV